MEDVPLHHVPDAPFAEKSDEEREKERERLHKLHTIYGVTKGPNAWRRARRPFKVPKKGSYKRKSSKSDVTVVSVSSDVESVPQIEDVNENSLRGQCTDDSLLKPSGEAPIAEKTEMEEERKKKELFAKLHLLGATKGPYAWRRAKRRFGFRKKSASKKDKKGSEPSVSVASEGTDEVESVRLFEAVDEKLDCFEHIKDSPRKPSGEAQLVEKTEAEEDRKKKQEKLADLHLNYGKKGPSAWLRARRPFNVRKQGANKRKLSKSDVTVVSNRTDAESVPLVDTANENVSHSQCTSDSLSTPNSEVPIAEKTETEEERKKKELFAKLHLLGATKGPYAWRRAKRRFGFRKKGASKKNKKVSEPEPTVSVASECTGDLESVSPVDAIDENPNRNECTSESQLKPSDEALLVEKLETKEESEKMGQLVTLHLFDGGKGPHALRRAKKPVNARQRGTTEKKSIKAAVSVVSSTVDVESVPLFDCVVKVEEIEQHQDQISEPPAATTTASQSKIVKSTTKADSNSMTHPVVKYKRKLNNERVDPSCIRHMLCFFCGEMFTVQSDYQRHLVDHQMVGLSYQLYEEEVTARRRPKKEKGEVKAAAAAEGLGGRRHTIATSAPEQSALLKEKPEVKPKKERESRKRPTPPKDEKSHSTSRKSSGAAAGPSLAAATTSSFAEPPAKSKKPLQSPLPALPAPVPVTEALPTVAPEQAVKKEERASMPSRSASPTASSTALQQPPTSGTPKPKSSASCTKCEMDLPSKSALVVHWVNMHSADIETIRMSGFAGDTKIVERAIPDEETCAECSLEFSTPTRFFIHLLQVHRDVLFLTDDITRIHLDVRLRVRQLVVDLNLDFCAQL